MKMEVCETKLNNVKIYCYLFIILFILQKNHKILFIFYMDNAYGMVVSITGH